MIDPPRINVPKAIHYAVSREDTLGWGPHQFLLLAIWAADQAGSEHAMSLEAEYRERIQPREQVAEEVKCECRERGWA